MAFLVMVTVLLGAYAAVLVAMAHLGPPPLDGVAHLLSTDAGDTDTGALQPAVLASRRPLPVDPDDVDPRYLAMLIAFEDRRFYRHFGVDPLAVTRAGLELARHGHIVSGGSTLTMQVARILENKYRRSALVKLRQVVRALQLEERLTKRQILRLYLSLAPFGGRVKGVRAASLRYFGKEPRSLTVGEAALLVALPQAPELRRIDRYARAARRARDFVLRTVAAAGVLTPEEAERAMREPVRVPIAVPLRRRATPQNLVSFGE